jgi:hypothetical protein
LTKTAQQSVQEGLANLVRSFASLLTVTISGALRSLSGREMLRHCFDTRRQAPPIKTMDRKEPPHNRTAIMF